MLTLIAPTLYGTPALGDYWLYSSYWEDAVYIGVLPLLLAVAALLGSLRFGSRKDGLNRLAWFLGAISLIAFALALGSNTPLFPWLYRNIPTFALFQAPARWMIWAEFSLALLAGLGAQQWRRPQGWGLYWARMATMGAVAVSLGAGLTWIYLGEVSPSFIRAAAILGLLGVGAGFLSQFAPIGENSPEINQPEEKSKKTGLRRILIQLKPPQPKPRPVNQIYRQSLWEWAVAVFIAIDLLAAGWGLNPGVVLDLYDPAPNAAEIQEMVSGGRLYLNQVQEDRLKYIRFMRFNTFNIGEDWLNLRSVFLPNLGMLDGIASTSNFDPFVPGRYAGWRTMLLEAPATLQDKLLRLMDVRAIETLDRKAQYGVRFSPIDGKRLRIVDCAIYSNGPEGSLTWMADDRPDHRIDFDHQVIVEGPVSDGEACAPGQTFAVDGSENAVLEIPDTNPNEIAIQTDSGSPGWLVVSDVWYPGWRAWVDGHPVTLYRADYLFMALLLPEGTHQVVISYRPWSFYLGCGISLFSLLLLGWVWLKIRRNNLHNLG